MKNSEEIRGGVMGSRERCLENLAFRYYLKDRSRSAEENWALAERFLEKLEKRYNIVEEHLK